jgi:hypothetical protein
VTIKSHRTYMNLTDAFFKQTLSPSMNSRSACRGGPFGHTTPIFHLAETPWTSSRHRRMTDFDPGCVKT